MALEVFADPAVLRGVRVEVREEDGIPLILPVDSFQKGLEGGRAIGPAFRQARSRGLQKEGILEGDWRGVSSTETFNKDGTPFFGGP